MRHWYQQPPADAKIKVDRLAAARNPFGISADQGAGRRTFPGTTWFLARRLDRIAQRQRPAAAAPRVLVFRLAAQAYALPVACLREIVPLAQLSRPPALPPLLAGFLNLEGRAVPVVRLARLLGAAEQRTGLYTPVLILRGDSSVALLVDAVEGIVTLDDAALVPIRESFCVNDCATGLALVGDKHVVLLDERRLVRAEEQRRIDELAALAQSRWPICRRQRLEPHGRARQEVGPRPALCPPQAACDRGDRPGVLPGQGRRPGPACGPPDDGAGHRQLRRLSGPPRGRTFGRRGVRRAGRQPDYRRDVLLPASRAVRRAARAASFPRCWHATAPRADCGSGAPAARSARRSIRWPSCCGGSSASNWRAGM